MEDSDAAGTRKRPRLDSGSQSYRSMSADQLHSPTGSPSIPPAVVVESLSSHTHHVPSSNILSPSKLPINIRDNSTTRMSPSLPSPNRGASVTTQVVDEIVAVSAQNHLGGSAFGSGGSSPMHSPEIEVAEIEDMDGDTTETRWRSLREAAVPDMRRLQTDLLMDFPFLDLTNNLIATVGTITSTFEKSELLLNFSQMSLLTVP